MISFDNAIWGVLCTRSIPEGKPWGTPPCVPWPPFTPAKIEPPLVDDWTDLIKKINKKNPKNTERI